MLVIRAVRDKYAGDLKNLLQYLFYNLIEVLKIPVPSWKYRIKIVKFSIIIFDNFQPCIFAESMTRNYVNLLEDDTLFPGSF